jgi:DNA-binding NtrC family response regulator
LVVDDEPGILRSVQLGLARHYGAVEVADSAESAEERIQSHHFDLLISDIRLPGLSGLRWVENLREQGRNLQVIFMTAHADLETAIAALRAGAADFIPKPFLMEQLCASVERCYRQQHLARRDYVLRHQLDQIFTLEGLVGRCEVITGVCDIIKRLAPMPSTVLIEGESGTGKELAARALHFWSRRSGPFVPVNCAGISPELLESELFGHAKGAFTGAIQAREGLFAYAQGGTVFLDEIGEMPLAMQALP